MKESAIPIEDIGFLVLDHKEIYLSIPAMIFLVDSNTAIISAERIIFLTDCF